MGRPGRCCLYPLLPAILVAATLAFTCAPPVKSLPVFEIGQTKPVKKAPSARQLTFKIKKMSCAACALNYVTILSKKAGITYARVELHSPWDADVTVSYDSAKITKRRILAELHKLHYYEASVKDK